MNPQLINYIQQKRLAGVPDDQIKQNLLESGWELSQVSQALSINPGNDAPPPPVPLPAQPIAVVNTFTTRGIEYVIMFISLWVTATTIGVLLHDLVDNMFTTTGGESYFNFIVP